MCFRKVKLEKSGNNKPHKIFINQLCGDLRLYMYMKLSMRVIPTKSQLASFCKVVCRAPSVTSPTSHLRLVEGRYSLGECTTEVKLLF